MILRHIYDSRMSINSKEFLIFVQFMTDNFMNRSEPSLGPYRYSLEGNGIFGIMIGFPFVFRAKFIHSLHKEQPRRILSQNKRGITRHGIAIHDFCHTAGRTSRVLRSRSIKPFNRRLGKENLFAAIRGNGCRQRLQTNLKGTRAQLTIQGVARQFIRQLFRIQQGISFRVLFRLHFLFLCRTCGEKPRRNLRKGRFGSVKGLGETANSPTTLDFPRMFAAVCRVRTNDVKLNVRVAISRARIVDFGPPLMHNQLSRIREVLDPEQRIVTDVFAHNGRRIQRGKVTDADRTRRVESRHGVQHNGTLIRILLCIRQRNGKNGNDNVSLTTVLEHEGFDFDALTTGKDVRNRHGTDVGHGHGIVKGLEFLIQINDQITILQAVCPHSRAVFRRPTMEPKDVLGTDVVFDDDPFCRRAHLFQDFIFPDSANHQGTPVHPFDHQLGRNGLSRVIEKRNGAPFFHVLDGAGHGQGQGGGPRFIGKAFEFA